MIFRANVVVAVATLAVHAAYAQAPGAGLPLPDGSTYHGALSNGLCEGAGVLVCPNGDRYEGTFREGQLEGSGTCRYAAGGSYSGEYKRGHANGAGALVLRNGDRYEGGFKDDLMEGAGVYSSSWGSVYSGQFRNGEYDGTGVLRNVDGSCYEGPFKGGQPDGTGRLRYRDGGCYEGNFRNGGFHGQGVLRYPGGDTYSGEFRDGQFVGAPTYRRSISQSVLWGLLATSLVANVVLLLRIGKRAAASARGAPSDTSEGKASGRREGGMTMVFTAPGVASCDLIKGMLEAHGIRAVLRNERGSAATGTGVPVAPMPSAAFDWPEVWVATEDAGEVRVIVDAWGGNKSAPGSP